MLPGSAILFKLIYARLFIQFDHFKRFMVGILLLLISVILILAGIKMLVISCVYIGSFILGIATALTFLPVIGYIKYFPSKFVSFYVAGLAFAGFFLSALYLIALKFNFTFLNVYW